MGFILTKVKLKSESSLDNMLKKTAGFHGHLCPGTVIGTRMAIAGLMEVGITDPEGSQEKEFLVFVETDRCPIDAISVVSGARISRRSLKFLDWGKVAATFVNTKTGKAVRIVCPDSARELVDNYAPGEPGMSGARKNADENPPPPPFDFSQGRLNPLPEGEETPLPFKGRDRVGMGLSSEKGTGESVPILQKLFSKLGRPKSEV